MIPAYDIRDLKFSYGGAHTLDIPALTIPDGEIIDLVGPNGSGKSTLLHLMAFIESPASGTIDFFGQRSASKNLLSMRRSVGLLLQNPYLFHETVLSNLVWPLRLRGLSVNDCRERALRALETVGLSGFEHRDARLLSGGETQRTALARTLALEPRVLLLDEPFNHMDRESAERTEDLIQKINAEFNKTVVMTSHSAKSRYTPHKTLHIFKGRIIPAAPDNIFRGMLMDAGRAFNTGRILVYLTEQVSRGDLITIDPSGIKVSLDAPIPGTQNAYPGSIIGLNSEDGRVKLEIDVGEVVRVVLPADSEILPHLRLGSNVWISLEPGAVSVLAEHAGEQP